MTVIRNYWIRQYSRIWITKINSWTPNQSIENFIRIGMEGMQSALNILTFVTTLKGQKILGRFEPDEGFQVGKV